MTELGFRVCGPQLLTDQLTKKWRLTFMALAIGQLVGIETSRCKSKFFLSWIFLPCVDQGVFGILPVAGSLFMVAL